MATKFTYKIEPMHNGGIKFIWRIKFGESSQSLPSEKDEVRGAGKSALPWRPEGGVEGYLPLQRVKDERGTLGQYLDLLVANKDRLREDNEKLLKEREAFLAERLRASQIVRLSVQRR